MQQILNEWAGTDSYATRISKLQAGTGVPQLKAGVTVKKDTGGNNLDGGADSDWLLGNFAGTGTLDNKSNGETYTDL